MQLLPLFPLNLVVFPNERLNLHIFEPRYKQLIADSQANDATFGIPVFLEEQLAEYGTEVALVAIARRYGGGEMDIRIEGKRIFSIQEFYPEAAGKLYANGQVLFMPTIMDYNVKVYRKIKELLLQLYQILGIKKQFDTFNSFDIAHHIGLSVEQEYEILGLPTERERQDYILKHLEQMVPIIIETERLKAKIKMNGYFRKLNPLDF